MDFQQINLIDKVLKNSATVAHLKFNFKFYSSQLLWNLSRKIEHCSTFYA